MKIFSPTLNKKVDAEVVGDPADYIFGAYLIGVGMGFECAFVVVEADTLQDALDEYADSDYAHWTEVEDEPEEEYHSRIGNYGKRHNLEEVRIHEKIRL